MKAVLCEAHGGPDTLKVRTVPKMTITEGAGDFDVIISVMCAGVAFTDTLMIENKYQFKPPLPFSPGSEVTGVVKAVGRKVQNFRPGDRVFASCMFGGFAEEVKCNVTAVAHIPEALGWAVPLCLGYNYGTSLFALGERGHLKKGETLLVLGAGGGVGLAAVELGKRIFGATVIAAASSDEKLELCTKFGADHTINYAKEDLKTGLTRVLGKAGGVDVVYDAVGGQWTEPALRSMAWNGRYLIIGFASGPIPKIPANLPLLKNCAVVGVFWGAWVMRNQAAAREDRKRLVDWCVAGKLRPHISKMYRLEDGAQALRDVLDRKVVGKTVVMTDAFVSSNAIAAAKL